MTGPAGGRRELSKRVPPPRCFYLFLRVKLIIKKKKCKNCVDKNLRIALNIQISHRFACRSELRIELNLKTLTNIANDKQSWTECWKQIISYWKSFIYLQKVHLLCWLYQKWVRAWYVSIKNILNRFKVFYNSFFLSFYQIFRYLINLYQVERAIENFGNVLIKELYV